ncbi:MAG: PAS domain-containing protein [Vulcanimicrobiaceae bacterium]
MRRLLLNLPEVIVRLERDGTIRFVTANIFDQFGYAQNAVVGTPVSHYLPQADTGAVRGLLQNAIRGRTLRAPIELHIRRRDGTLASAEFASFKFPCATSLRELRRAIRLSAVLFPRDDRSPPLSKTNARTCRSSVGTCAGAIALSR